jgi:threonine 3-dehydrogenase
MKALVKSKSEPGLWLEDVEEPKIGINDVLIQVLKTGICGTDVHIYKWDDWARKTIPVPMAIGHEFAGKIVETGANVADFFPGDIVSGEGHVVCGRCRNCLAGRRQRPLFRGRGYRGRREVCPEPYDLESPDYCRLRSGRADGR